MGIHPVRNTTGSGKSGTQRSSGDFAQERDKGCKAGAVSGFDADPGGVVLVCAWMRRAAAATCGGNFGILRKLEGGSGRQPASANGCLTVRRGEAQTFA